MRRLGVLNPDLDACLQIQRARVEGHQGFGHTRVRGKLLILYRGVRSALSRQVIDAQHHVLGRCGNRSPVRRRQDVVRGQHQNASLGLSFCRQREVNCHLVTVEVRVERGTHQRMNLDGLALDQLRLERLDTQTVQGRCTVQQHRVLGDDLFQHIPHDRPRAFDHALRALDVLRVVEVDKTLHDEGLEELECHLLGQTALVQLQLRPDDDDRSA